MQYKHQPALEIKKLANQIRQDVITMLLEAGSGHSAGPLGLADVFAALYAGVLRHDPENPNWKDRDKLFLSAGHNCPVLYAVLARVGYFPHSELMTLRKINSRLQGHPHNLSLPGIGNTGGPLGQGISQAIGAALAARLDQSSNHIFCILSDGEHDEGQTWEAIMFAAKEKLANLTTIIDRNGIQISGLTEKVMPLEPLRQKYESFGWRVVEIDGHDIEEIIDACSQAKASYERPTAIIAHTIPGKGVDFMESDYRWHGTPPNEEQAKDALKELRTLGGKIISEHD